ncbi:MAG: hypothetical protein PHN75_13140 [Syntrophales bacterium]|nr:hypothetical protein [Syntrophales bacterium]
MIRFITCCWLPLVFISISGCADSFGNLRWVSDPDRYIELSGFAVKPPTGQDWAVYFKDKDFPNAISFTKLSQTPIRNNVEHPEFSVNVATVFGTAFYGLEKGAVDDETKMKILQQALQFQQKQQQYQINKSSLTQFQGAKCISYSGRQLVPEVDITWGTINYERVNGYMCLHPDYHDFLVVIVWKDGSSVGQSPVNRDDQLGNFLNSIRFTPRKIHTAPDGKKSNDEGKRTIS